MNKKIVSLLITVGVVFVAVFLASAATRDIIFSPQASDPYTCNASTTGAMYFKNDQKLYYCNGSSWTPNATQGYVDTVLGGGTTVTENPTGGDARPTYYSDASTYVSAMKFTTNRAGAITKLRMIGNNGQGYTMKLWNASTQAVLATVGVTGAGAGNWVEGSVNVSSSIGSAYVVSAYMDSFYYSSTGCPTGVQRGSITVDDCRFLAGSDAFPTIVNSSLRPVDVTFSYTAVTTSQWTTTSTSIYYSAGNVGIGTAAPAGQLQSYTAGATSAAPLIMASGGGYVGSVVLGNYESSDATRVNRYTWGRDNQTTGDFVFAHNGSRLYTIQSGGNVGIGTIYPSSTLHVVGAATFGSTVIVGTPTIASHAATKGYVDTAVAGGSQWVTTSTTSAYYNNSGNVGIGTTSPGYKTVVYQAAASGVDIGYGGTNANARFHMAIGQPGVKALYIGTDTVENMVVFGNHAASSGYKWISHNGSAWVESMRIHTNGNIGIGTASPGAKLDVALAGTYNTPIIRAIDGAHNIGLGVDSTATYWGGSVYVDGVRQATFENGGLIVGSTYSSTYNAPAGGILVEGNVDVGGANLYLGSDVRFYQSGQWVYVYDDAGSYSNKGWAAYNFWANNDVYLGARSGWISALLDAKLTSNTGLARIQPQTGSYGSINITGTTGGYAGVHLSDTSGTVVGMSDASGNGGDYDPTTGWHFYWSRANTSLGIGGSTTESGYRSYVNGNEKVGGNMYATGDIYHGTRGVWLSSWLNQNLLTSASPTFANVIASSEFYVLNGGYTRMNSNQFYCNNGSSCHFNYSGTGATYVGNGAGTYLYGTVTSAGSIYAPAFYYTSDIRLKTNIKPTAGLDVITKINGVTFAWKDSGEKSAGVIAQEVEKVFPEAVYKNKDTGYLSVNGGALMGPVVESIKELNSKLEAQDKRITELQKEIQRLKNK